MVGSREHIGKTSPIEDQLLCMEAAHNYMAGTISVEEYERIGDENGVDWVKASKLLGTNSLPQPFRSIMRRLI